MTLNNVYLSYASKPENLFQGKNDSPCFIQTVLNVFSIYGEAPCLNIFTLSLMFAIKIKRLHFVPRQDSRRAHLFSVPRARKDRNWQRCEPYTWLSLQLVHIFQLISMIEFFSSYHFFQFVPVERIKLYLANDLIKWNDFLNQCDKSSSKT